MSHANEIYILSVYCNEATDFDLKDIFKVIGVDVVNQLTWGVAMLEWFGAEDAQQFNQEVDNAARHHLLVTGERLMDVSQSAAQTIEGTFVGYRSREDAREFLEVDWSLNRFRTSPAKIAIVAVDGCWFDVYLRTRLFVDRLVEHFVDVRPQDPTDFLE